MPLSLSGLVTSDSSNGLEIRSNSFSLAAASICGHYSSVKAAARRNEIAPPNEAHP